MRSIRRRIKKLENSIEVSSEDLKKAEPIIRDFVAHLFPEEEMDARVRRGLTSLMQGDTVADAIVDAVFMDMEVEEK